MKTSWKEELQLWSLPNQDPKCSSASLQITFRDLLLLRNLWSRIGSYTNYQATFCDFHWGEERLAVSTTFLLGPRLQQLELRVLCFVKAILQQYFNCAMRNIADQITAEQCFSVEFKEVDSYRFMSVRYWKNNVLSRVFVCRSGLLTTGISGEFESSSRLLSVTSPRRDLVACSGSPANLIRSIDLSEHFTRGVQSCHRFEHLSLQTLMHKSSYSVFGRIDFFSTLQALLV